MTLAQNVTALATAVGGELKETRVFVNNNAADLSALTTTAQGNLVAAINEVKVIADAAAGGGVAINDAIIADDSTWSSEKIDDEIGVQVASGVASVIDTAPGTLDTLNELAAALGDDANYAATTTAALGNRVRFDASQTLTSPQKTQALANIGAAAAGDLTTLSGTVTTLSGTVTTLSTNVGVTTTDFAAAFTTALT